MEWHFYQALAGAWPAGLGAADVRGDEPRLAGLRRRMSAYFEKAAREAKQRTSWLDQDTAYEHALSNFVTAVLSPETGRRFLQDFAATCAPLWCAGAVNSLAQLAIKLTAPGVPDFYQGAELWDLSLVDPDNRAPVDFASRQALIDTIAGTAPETWLAAWTSGAPKLALMLAGLAMRSRRPALFAEGAYTPLAATGAHSRRIVAFARALDGTWAVTIVSRFALALLDGAEQPLVPPARWGDTAVTLPTGLRGRGLCDLLTGAVYRSDDALAAVTVLARFPIALLVDADEDCL